MPNIVTDIRRAVRRLETQPHLVREAGQGWLVAATTPERGATDAADFSFGYYGRAAFGEWWRPDDALSCGHRRATPNAAEYGPMIGQPACLAALREFLAIVERTPAYEAGRAAYEADRRQRPAYHDGTRRPPFERLGEVERGSWGRERAA